MKYATKTTAQSSYSTPLWWKLKSILAKFLFSPLKGPKKPPKPLKPKGSTLLVPKAKKLPEWLNKPLQPKRIEIGNIDLDLGNKGFTLLEMIMVMAIMAILSLKLLPFVKNLVNPPIPVPVVEYVEIEKIVERDCDKPQTDFNDNRKNGQE